MNLAFANPEWLWCLLLLVPLALLRIWSQWRGKKGAPGLVSPRLTSDLIVGATQWKRWVIFAVQLAALAFLLLALARPQWGFEEAEFESEGRSVFIAIDTSRSMMARDLLPDRLTRAKLAAQDVVDALPADRIGLIAFAGRAFLQAPLTVDHDAVLETIRQFDTELVPRGGTNLASPVRLAIETLEKAESESSALILFSDGENLEGDEDFESLRERAERVGLVLVAVGVGSETGELIPETDDKGRVRPGEFVKDDDGTVVRSRLDPSAMQELSAQVGGGVFVSLGATASLPDVVTRAIENIEAVRQKGDSRRRPIERFMWPLGISVSLFLVAWLLPGTLRLLSRIFVASPKSGSARTLVSPDRVGVQAPSLEAVRQKAAATLVAGAIFLGPLLFPSTGAAQGTEGKSAGFAALKRQSYDSAVNAYERELADPELAAEKAAWLNLGLGTAAYKSGDFEKAKTAFGKALEFPADNGLETKAHHNLGNALFRSGESMMGPKSPDPNQPQFDGAEAQKEMIAEQWRSAIEHYRAALQADEGNQHARHNLGVVQKRLELLMQEPPEEEEQEKEDQPENDQQNDEGDDNQNQNQPNQQDNPNDQPQDPNQENQGDENPQDPNNEGDNEQQPPQERQPDENQDPEQGPDEPQEPKEPKDGKLDAQPDQPKPGEPDRPPEPREVNPETGFSPEEARQKLRTLSDEDLEVRPAARMKIKAERYKNW